MEAIEFTKLNVNTEPVISTPFLVITLKLGPIFLRGKFVKCPLKTFSTRRKKHEYFEKGMKKIGNKGRKAGDKRD